MLVTTRPPFSVPRGVLTKTRSLGQCEALPSSIAIIAVSVIVFFRHNRQLVGVERIMVMPIDAVLNSTTEASSAETQILQDFLNCSGSTFPPALFGAISRLGSLLVISIPQPVPPDS